MTMKPGTKLKSGACDTEVMIIKAPADVSIYCGGVAMSPDAPANIQTPDSEFAEGTLMGKRYVDEAGAVELLCVKAGAGSLSVEGTKLGIKDAKPLPSSD